MLTREAEDIIDGYNRKLVREAKLQRKLAFISILPHTKNLTEKKFNNDIWPIDELTDDKYSADRIKGIQEKVRHYQKKLGEERRNKKK